MITLEERRRRNPELDALLREFERNKDRLQRFIAAAVLPAQDLEEARAFASQRGGLLCNLWLDFLALPRDQQLAALSEQEFRGMHWQSLVQSNPLAVTPSFRDFK